MPLTTTGDLITSDRATRIARLVRGRPPAWQVTRLPGQLLDRGSAVTVIAMAVAAASGPRPGHRIWPHTGTRAAEPGQPVPQAIILTIRPLETASGRNQPSARLAARRADERTSPAQRP